MKAREAARTLLLSTAALLLPYTAAAQQPGNVPTDVRQAEATTARTVQRFGIGVEGGVGLDPELVEFGGHAAFAPVFTPDFEFRPGVEFGIGEVTTVFAINLDVLYFFPGATDNTRWVPYVGAGPAFGLSHRGFETEDSDNVDIDGQNAEDLGRNRFNFSDTDFNGGMNFIAGARSRSGMFFELKTTAWGVSNVRLLAGFNF